MATYGTQVRRGLPRRAGAEAWPPAGVVSADVPQMSESVPDQRPPAANEAAAPGVGVPQIVESSTGERPSEANEPQAPVAELVEASSPSSTRTLRRGLPRTSGGEPWPAAASVVAPVIAQPVIPRVEVRVQPGGPLPVETAHPHTESPSAENVPTPDAATTVAGTEVANGTALRRGLPRAAGGEPWPPAGTVAAKPSPTLPSDEVAVAAASVAATGPELTPQQEVVVLEATEPRVLAPLAFTLTVFPGTGGRAPRVTKPEPERVGPFTKLQWAGAVIVGGGGLLFAAAMAVLAVRWLLSLEPLQDFVATYPGEYHLPEGAPVGIPAWLGWQHFFNVFLMVLIIRSGLQVRGEKRPSVFWSPRNTPKRKISLALWFHQSLDILWVVNGVIFVVLLFVTGQWMKIVPTSWEVIPNAISAALQYVSLDWPTENGWVNYNSLQQLAYFATVFIAAPLAIITGVRMSGIWPKNAKALNKAYPVEWARAVHFPVMLYFVAFIAIHVFLVLATGALRNLNHMYAAQGSVDPNAYADNWTGFWFFVASLVVIAAAWVAARPLVLAPIARLFGKVSGR